MMRTLLGALLVLALAGCNEEDEGRETESGSAVTSGADSSEEQAADDGGGAMDGAAATDTAASDASGADGSSEVSQDAIDSCIDRLRSVEGATGGTVTRTEFSEANSLVMLEDASGKTWRCIVSNDGSNPSLEAEDAAAAGEDPTSADDGGGAMDGASTDAAMPISGSPADVTDFQGAPAGQAAADLQSLGFESLRSEGPTTYWFNRETGACARITTSDGILSEVVMLPAEDC